MAQGCPRRTRGRPACSDVIASEALLTNARREFALHGFEATSVRAIAKLSGVDAALVSHHFGSKSALWCAVLEQIAELAAPMRNATESLRDNRSLDIRTRIEQAIVLFIDQVFRTPDIGMFFSTAATEQGERLDLLIEHLMRPYQQAFVPLLEEAMASGVLPKDDPMVMFAMMTNGISKTVAYRHVLAPFTAVVDRPDEFKNAVLRASLRMFGWTWQHSR
jgi:AcrR family transcriptional regulator